MVNSRQKGKIGEKLVLDFLNKHTPYKFELTPGSGSGKIKGDIHIPKFKNRFCIEVKNYAESPISDKILTNKSNDFVNWWCKLLEQCLFGYEHEPLLFFRYNRSKLFVVTNKRPVNLKKSIDIPGLKCYIMLAEEWITHEKIDWLIL